MMITSGNSKKKMPSVLGKAIGDLLVAYAWIDTVDSSLYILKK